MNKIFLFAILTGMFAASCTDHFAEYNSNPYGVSDEVLASGGIAEQVANDCEFCLVL